MKKKVLFIAALLVLSLMSTVGLAESDPEYAKALKCYHMKKFDRAAEILKNYIEEKPEPAAYYLLGYSLYEIGRQAEAREYFDEAYLIDPEFSLEKAGLINAAPKKGVKKKGAALRSGKEKRAP